METIPHTQGLVVIRFCGLDVQVSSRYHPELVPLPKNYSVHSKWISHVRAIHSTNLQRFT
jgi:hypothetical protein